MGKVRQAEGANRWESGCDFAIPFFIPTLVPATIRPEKHVSLYLLPGGSFMSDPKQMLMETIFGRWRSQILYAGVSLGLFEEISDTPVASDAFAGKLKLNPVMTYRLMRALACLGVMSEAEDKKFSLSPAGKFLQAAHPESLRGMVLLEEGPEHYAVWKHLPVIVREGGKDGFAREFGRPIFQHAVEDGPYGKVFNEAMSSYSASETAMVLNALKDETFRGVNHLCDVAGGHGHLLCSLLKEHPNIAGTVFDLPSTFAGKDLLWAGKMGVEDRCTYVPGNMFESVPVADGYLMKHILHDWDDEKCVRILSNISEKAKSGARLFVAEFVVSGPQAPHFAKLFDVHMMCATSGEERTEAEYAALFTRSGWKHMKTTPSFGPISVIEAVRGG